MADQIPTANRQVVVARAEGHCERCGVWGATDAHHRRPKGLGGSKRADRHNVENLLLLCRDCHSWAHGKPTESRPVGYLVPRSSGADPAAVPVHLFHGLMLLMADGTYAEVAR